MAIIQSILVGKGKGKIGNVVLSGLKGQTVAKQLNSSPSNPQTVAQTENRVKMTNAVLAWQYVSLFFDSAKGLRKPLESTYNAFVRIVKNELSDTLYESRMLAGVAALQLNSFVGNWFTITGGSFITNGVKLKFSAPGIAWASTYRARIMLVDLATGKQLVEEVPISELAFNSGEISVAKAGLDSFGFACGYIFDSASSKITNIRTVTP